MDDAMLEMLETFLEEAHEHLDTIEQGLLATERDNSNKMIINDIFRGIHSIKGGSGFFELDKLGELSHIMEELLSLARNERIVLEGHHVGLLLECLDLLKTMLDSPDQSEEVDTAEHLEKLRAIVAHANGEQAAPVQIEKKSADQSILEEFSIEEESLAQQANQGFQVYRLEFNSKSHIEPMGESLQAYLTGLAQMGEILACIPSCDEIKNPDFNPNQTIKLLYTTAMDPDLAAIVFVIPEDNFSLITLEQYQKPVQVVGKDQKVHTIGEEPEEKEPAPQEPVVPEIILAPEPVKRQKKGKLAELDMQEQETLRVKIKQLNKLVNLAGELVLSRNQLMRIAETHLKQATGFQSILKNLSIVISDLQEQIMNTRMQPISAICNKFPRIVRDLSGQLQKSVEFQIDGGEIELDKTIIEALADPLTHIIRNVVDHGIELPEERRALDKPATGSLLLKAYHESGQVIIEIQDDGKGIDPDKIASKALSKNIVSEFQIAGMTDREKIRLVFAPGFSTAESISNISGRGVGMDVVKTNIEKIGGTVELDSVVNHGTTVRMTLPLTLAIVSSLIAKVKDRKFIIPQVNIDELITLDSASLDERLGKVQESNVLKLRGSLLPLVPMSVALGFEEDTGDLRLTDQNAELRIIVVKIGAQLLGLIVDEILGIEEIVVKPLPQYLRILNQYSGCSILGDGSVALILDLLELAKNQRMLLEKAASHEIAESHGEPHQNQENRALLIFDNGTSEQFALPISSIERIDKITEQEIQTVGNKEFIEHQGRSMRVLRLEEILNLKAPDSRFGKNTCILILKNTTHLCSILIHNIVDSRSVSDELEQDTLDIPGVLGSIMVDKKITVLLDLPALLQLVFNETEAIC